MSPGLVNKHLTTLPYLMRAECNKQITPRIEARLIAEARKYARQNKLPFDGTMKGVYKLAEEADQVHRDYITAYNKEQAEKHAIKDEGPRQY